VVQVIIMQKGDTILNQTIKNLLPHFYITLALLMGYFAIPQVIPFKQQYYTYSAVVLWTIIMAISTLIVNNYTNKKDSEF